MKHKFFKYSKIFYLILLLLLTALLGLAWSVIINQYFFKISFSFFTIICWIMFIIMYSRPLFTWQKDQWLRRVQIFIHILLVFAIFSLLHYWNYKFSYSIDLTRQKIHELTPSSKKILQAFIEKSKTSHEKLELLLFAARNEWDSYLPLLKKYTQNDAITLKPIDADKHPEILNQYQVKKLPAFLWEKVAFKNVAHNATSSAATESTTQMWVDNYSEAAMTSALKKILNPNLSPLLCFTTGHGEASLQNTALDGISTLKEMLQQESYRVQQVDLSQNLDLNQDYQCDLLLIIGPKDDFLASEISKLALYQKNNKNLVIALDPFTKKDFLINLRTYLKNTFHLAWSEGVIIDQTSSSIGEEAINVLWQDPVSAQRVILQLSASFEFERQTPPDAHSDAHLSAPEVLISSAPFPNSWLETNWQEVSKGKIVFTPNVDIKGSLPLVVKVDRNLFFATSRVVMNGMKPYPNNFSWFLQRVPELIENQDRTGSLKAELIPEHLWFSEQQANLVFYVAIIFIPLSLLITAFLVFKMRSNDELV